MSFGSEPQRQTQSTNPFKGMPSWARDYYRGTVEDARASDARADALRAYYSGMEFVPTSGEGAAGTASAGTGATSSGGSSHSGPSDPRLQTLDLFFNQIPQSGGHEGTGSFGGKTARQRAAASRNQQPQQPLGTSGTLQVAGAQGGGFDPGMEGAGSRLVADYLGQGGVNRALGGANAISDAAAFGNLVTDAGIVNVNDIAEQIGMLPGDIEATQQRYENQYIDDMLDPVMSRMREDEARRLAELEGSAATIGGFGNTRMGVEAARLSDEAMRSRAQAEADLRYQSLRTGQEMGMSEIGLRGELERLGLDANSVMAALARQGFDMEAAAGLAQMEAGSFEAQEAERRRLIQQEQMQAPLTMEAWYRSLMSTGLPAPLPGGGTTTSTTQGGGPGMGTQLVGAGTSLLGAAMMGGLFSDENVKEDVEGLDGEYALEMIRQQRPSSYRYSDPEYDRVPVEGRRSAGLMAQDLEGIEGAVFEGPGGVKMVDPYPVMATIVAAVQELDRRTAAAD